MITHSNSTKPKAQHGELKRQIPKCDRQQVKGKPGHNSPADTSHKTCALNKPPALRPSPALTPRTQYLTQTDTATMIRTHRYRPQPEGIGATWENALELFIFLKTREDERDRIRREISEIDPGQPSLVWIWHGRAPRSLLLSTVDTDETFERRLTACIHHEEARWLHYAERNIQLPPLPDEDWDKIAAAYPRFRPPVMAISAIPLLPPLPSNEGALSDDVSTPAAAPCSRKVLTTPQASSSDQGSRKGKRRARVNRITLLNKGPKHWQSPHDVFHFLLARQDLRIAILQRAEILRGDALSSTAIGHKVLRAPIILKHTVDDEEFCKILKEQLIAAA